MSQNLPFGDLTTLVADVTPEPSPVTIGRTSIAIPPTPLDFPAE